jgi:hypothetical protein
LKNTIAAALLAAITAWATTVQAADKYTALSINPSELKGEKITYLVRDGYTGLMLTTAGNAGFAVVGVLAAIPTSKALWNNNHLQDPSNAASSDIASRLIGQLGMVAGTPMMLEGKVNYDDVGVKTGARFVLDIQSRTMLVSYYPLHWTKYGLLYLSTAQLYDTKTRKVVASGVCTVPRESEETAPTYDEMTTNEAAGLKAMLGKSAEACAAQFRTKLFALADNPPVAAPTPGQDVAAPLAAIAVSTPAAKAPQEIGSPPAATATPTPQG